MDSETAPTRPTEAIRARETEKVFIVSGYWLTVVKVLHKKQLLAADSKDHQRRRMNWTGELRKIKKKGFRGRQRG